MKTYSDNRKGLSVALRGTGSRNPRPNFGIRCWRLLGSYQYWIVAPRTLNFSNMSKGQDVDQICVGAV